jgi:hypothetical protein
MGRTSLDIRNPDPILSGSDSRSPISPVRAQFDTPVSCSLNFTARTDIGPNADLAYQGTMTILIQTDGAVDEGILQTPNGASFPVVGQIAGRSVRLRIDLGNGDALSLTGSAVEPVDQCSGNFIGAFGGPAMQDIGSWSATGQGAT